ATDPTAVNILNWLKSHLPAEQPKQSGDIKYTYRTLSPTPQSNNEYLAKTEHQLGPNHRLTLSYFTIKTNQLVDLGGFTQAWSYSNYAARQQNANISEVWTVSNRSVNQFWVNYTRQFAGRIPVSSDPSKQTLADFGSDFGVVGTPSLPNIAISGVEAFTL